VVEGREATSFFSLLHGVLAVLSAAGEDGEEEPFLEPSWPHLQLVYEFLLRFIVSAEVRRQPCLVAFNVFPPRSLLLIA